MELLIVRHAIAEEPDVFAETGKPDSERPLTDDGRQKMRRAARGLAQLVDAPVALATSPYVRAAQTAQIVAESLGVPAVEVVDALTPMHHPKELMPWLARQPDDALVAVVGHEPHLGLLATWLISGREDSRVVLKKGGACLLDLGSPPGAATGALKWLATPRQLRAMNK